MLTMELSAKALAQALRSVSGVCRQNSIPILSNALIRIAGGKASVCATDLDRWVTSETECEGSGEVTVNAESLASIASALDGGSVVNVKANGRGILEISQGRAHFELPTLAAEDFPIPPDHKMVHSWTLDAGELNTALRALEPAIERGKRRYLNGVCFDIEMGRLVATDGSILGHIEIKNLKRKNVAQFTLPHESVAIVCALCKGADEIELSLQDDGNAASFKSGATIFRTKLIEDKFPDYQRVVPREGKVSGTVHCAELARALNCASLVTQSRDGVRIEVTLGQDEITIIGKDQDGGSAKDSCDWTRLSGEDMTVCFNAAFLRWAAGSLGEAKTLHLEIEDAGAPMVIRAEDDPNRSSVRVAMPRR